jgi:hypothetical protein
VTDGTGAWLALLAGLALLAALVLRRMGRLIARTRELEGFQNAARRLDRRFGAAADPLVVRLDELRRHSGDPQGLAELLQPASETLRAAAAEVKALRGPAQLRAEALGLARELDRAIRATEMVEHGLDALMAVRRGRELEAQTSLKRGALNLRHARSAFHEIVMQVLAVSPADIGTVSPTHTTAAGATVPTYIVDGIDSDLSGGYDPRM